MFCRGKQIKRRVRKKTKLHKKRGNCRKDASFCVKIFPLPPLPSRLSPLGKMNVKGLMITSELKLYFFKETRKRRHRPSMVIIEKLKLAEIFEPEAGKNIEKIDASRPLLSQDSEVLFPGNIYFQAWAGLTVTCSFDQINNSMRLW